MRDRSCACNGALHNIFAIVKCKVPPRGGSPAEPALPYAAFAHTTTPYRCRNGCSYMKRKSEKRSYGCTKARGNGRRLESKFLSSHVNRDTARAIEDLSTYFYIPVLKRLFYVAQSILLKYMLIFSRKVIVMQHYIGYSQQSTNRQNMIVIVNTFY